MFTVKYAITIACILTVHVSFGQTSPIEEEFAPYSQKYAALDFKKATKLEEMGLFQEALMRYEYVARFDSTSTIGQIAKHKLDSTWAVEKPRFQKQLSGKWRWIWSGTNWGTEDSPKECDCQKYIYFETDEVTFYNGDVMENKVSYRIVKDITEMRLGQFLIEFEEDCTVWRLKIHDEVFDGYYLLERSKNAELLLEARNITLYPNWACGCPVKTFEKM